MHKRQIAKAAGDRTSTSALHAAYNEQATIPTVKLREMMLVGHVALLAPTWPASSACPANQAHHVEEKRAHLCRRQSTEIRSTAEVSTGANAGRKLGPSHTARAFRAPSITLLPCLDENLEDFTEDTKKVAWKFRSFGGDLAIRDTAWWCRARDCSSFLR